MFLPANKDHLSTKTNVMIILFTGLTVPKNNLSLPFKATVQTYSYKLMIILDLHDTLKVLRLKGYRRLLFDMISFSA